MFRRNLHKVNLTIPSPIISWVRILLFKSRHKHFQGYIEAFVVSLLHKVVVQITFFYLFFNLRLNTPTAEQISPPNPSNLPYPLRSPTILCQRQRDRPSELSRPRPLLPSDCQDVVTFTHFSKSVRCKLWLFTRFYLLLDGKQQALTKKIPMFIGTLSTVVGQLGFAIERFRGNVSSRPRPSVGLWRSS